MPIKSANIVEPLFEITDGVTPNRRERDGAYELKSPYAFSLKPGQKLTLDLGVRCREAVHVFQAWEKVRMGIVLTDGVWAVQDCDPGKNLYVMIENVSREEVFFERGDLVARCALFSNRSPQM